MNGARKLAYDYILPLVTSGQRVLDLGAGSAPLAGMMAAKGCDVVALDYSGLDLLKAVSVTDARYIIEECDCTRGIHYPDADFDLVVAVYSVQHMLGRQAFVWSEVARVLKPGGQFVHIGRYRPDAPVLETNRQDPLLADNKQTIIALALTSGLQIDDLRVYQYDATSYREARNNEANAIVARMVKQ